MSVETVVAANELSLHARRRLVVIVSLLGILTVVHDLDHVRQGRALPAELYVVAVAALASIAATLTVLLRYPKWARTIAVAQGVATIVGVGAVHVAPHWSKITDSYAAAHVDIVSWAIIVAMMLAGLGLVLVAARPARLEPIREPAAQGSSEDAGSSTRPR